MITVHSPGYFCVIFPVHKWRSGVFLTLFHPFSRTLNMSLVMFVFNTFFLMVPPSPHVWSRGLHPAIPHWRLSGVGEASLCVIVLESRVCISSLYEHIICYLHTYMLLMLMQISAGFIQVKLHHEVSQRCTNTTGTQRSTAARCSAVFIDKQKSLLEMLHFLRLFWPNVSHIRN